MSAEKNVLLYPKNILVEILKWPLNRFFFGRKRFQKFFEIVHRIGIKGMNFDGSFDVDKSGELGVVKMLRTKSADKEFVVLDVGSNEGQYAAQFLDCFGGRCEMHCFEPSSPIFERLRKHLASRPGVRLHNFGLASRDQRVTLYSPPSEHGGSIFARDRYRNATGDIGAEEIELRSFGRFWRESNLSQVDFMKLDVEGAEFDVLMGAKEFIEQKKIRFIQFEFGTCDVESRRFFRDFFEFLSPNYDLYRIVQDGLWPIRRYNANHEIFLYANFFAELRSK